MRLFVYDMLVNVNVIYYVHVCEQARWARSAGNSAIENLCIIIIISGGTSSDTCTWFKAHAGISGHALQNRGLSQNISICCSSSFFLLVIPYDRHEGVKIKLRWRTSWYDDKQAADAFSLFLILILMWYVAGPNRGINPLFLAELDRRPILKESRRD